MKELGMLIQHNPTFTRKVGNNHTGYACSSTSINFYHKIVRFIMRDHQDSTSHATLHCLKLYTSSLTGTSNNIVKNSYY